MPAETEDSSHTSAEEKNSRFLSAWYFLRAFTVFFACDFALTLLIYFYLTLFSYIWLTFLFMPDFTLALGNTLSLTFYDPQQVINCATWEV